MLFNLSKKICPLIGLALMLGCGKKIGDPETTTSRQIPGTDEQKLPSVLTLRLNGAESNVYSFTIPANAWFKLPEKLIVRSGYSAGKRVKIYYNYSNSKDYEFQCTYYSTTNQAHLPFEKCQAENGDIIYSKAEDVVKPEFPMDMGKTVRMELLTPAIDFAVDSVYSVE